MKRLLLSTVLTACALLSGCIVVPVHRSGGYYHGAYGEYGYHRGGSVVVQPGPR